ncbi:hypothetical protein MPER_05552 [Moniliophthora perniciosa FA553]|nr:hypothetical protein MPER_05552 [Moniliophthora perniciosa FA553]
MPIQALRFPNFDIEKALHAENDFRMLYENGGKFWDEVQELEYEVVSEADMPRIRDDFCVLQDTGHVPLSSHQRTAAAKPSRPNAPVPSSSKTAPPSTKEHSKSKLAQRESTTNDSGSEAKLTARKRRNLEKQARKKERRRAAAKERDARVELSQYVVKQAQSAEPLVVDGFDVSSLPASVPAWIGTKEILTEKLPPLSKVKYFPWDGK